MSGIHAQQLTSQFYKWEQKGRGWTFFQEAVDLEPHFHPFFFHFVPPPPTGYLDDGKQKNVLSRIGDLFRFNSEPYREPEPDPYAQFEDDDEVQAHIFECNEPIIVYGLTMPKGQKIDPEATQHLLLMLSYCRYPISFEIVGGFESISFQIATRLPDAIHVQSQIKAYFPGCIIKERKDQISEMLQGEGKMGSIMHFGLKNEFMRPLKMADTFKVDPLIGVLGSLEHLEEGEHAVIQVLFSGAIHPWSESIIRSVSDNDGSPFFEDAPEMLPLAKEKISAPLFGVTMRIMGVGYSNENARAIMNMVGSAFGRLYFSPYNSLIKLSVPLDFDTILDDVLFRESHLVGMLLNSRELATIVHLPSESVVSEKLERDTRKTKKAPSITEGNELVLGINEHQGKSKEVSVSTSQRLKHTHIIGATGTGKSTFILSLIVQDIQHGKGIAVLDPHGDLIESILTYIPPERIKDVIVIDPADADFPVGFNILSAHSEIEKDILSSDLVAVFRRLSTSWGDQMNSVFANAILAILESKQGGTLIDLRRFLVEKSFRDAYLKTVADPNIVYYWQKEYPLLKSNSIGSILTRLDTFLRPKLIRNMVAQNKSLDFEDILDNQKILLVKLSQGLIGTENSYLLGTFFVTKMYQAAMARQIKSKTSRTDFFLYIDEFQNFITPSMSSILSGARKYGLGLILAHQDMTQLTKYDSELASSVVSNAGTRVCFRLGDTDAKRFESGFAYFDREDLENLHTGEAIARIERPEFDFSLTTIPLQGFVTSLGEEIMNAVIEKSRATYGTPRAEVETLLESLRGELAEELQKDQAPPVAPVQQKPPEGTPQNSSYRDNIVNPISPDSQAETIESLVKQKEQSQHKYLQNLVKRMAESRGYTAIIEEPVPGTKGRVDVSLQRNSRRIACEVCITTEVDWEIHNIEKCLSAGYDLVVECSNDKKTLENIRKKVESTFSGEVRSKILIVEPEEFFSYLDNEIAKEASQPETRMKGYRVKVEYDSTGASDMEKKKSAIGETIINAKKGKK